MFSLPTKCQTLAGMMMTAILVCGLTVLTVTRCQARCDDKSWSFRVLPCLAF